MSRLSITFLGTAIVAALGLALLQAPVSAGGSSATDLPDRHQVHATGHGSGGQGH